MITYVRMYGSFNGSLSASAHTHFTIKIFFSFVRLNYFYLKNYKLFGQSLMRRKLVDEVVLDVISFHY